MKKLLTALVFAVICAQAQTSPPPGTLPAAEILKYQREHDSMVVVIAATRRRVRASNDAYFKAHPNYLRQHPEVLKAHPEYRQRYAKYLQPAKSK